MGDFLSPKRRDVVDRLRRRLDLYRRHQHGAQQRYDFGQKAIYEQERQHALLLRQKLLESKAKKSSKSKTKSDNNHPDHRNQIVTKRLKHKLDGNSLEGQHQNHPDNIYRFEDDDAPPAKKISTSSSTNINGLSSSVSVHIVHQINGGNSQQEPNISTNVTVNQTINKSQSENETDAQSNVKCKKEPNEELTSQSNARNESDLDSELEHILNTFEDEDIPQELLDELSKFDEICRSVQDSETGNDSSTLNQSSDSGSMFASNMYVDPSQGPGQVRTPPVQQPHYRNTQPHTSSTMSEGGLAAETLKQMAAQHQQHHPNQDQFRVKSAVDPFSDLSETGQYGSRNGYSTTPDYYSGMHPPRSGSSGPYSGQNNNMRYPTKQGVPPYVPNANKLTHYVHNPTTSQSESTGPSSLQQLQKQVAHFNQSPQMEITQTQHMQVSDGSHRMQMSQTQHVQLRQPIQNISLTQQQGFSTSPNMGPSPTNIGPSPTNMGPSPNQSQNFMSNDQMSLQQQQLMQNNMRPDQRQAQMQQYMNRPPPEYKMQHANGMQPGMSSNGMGPNPLQTIQEMVNQTNTHQSQAYSSVKSESSDMQNGMRTAQMTAMQQQMAGSVNPIGMRMSQAQLNYSNQAVVQRQASFPGALSHPMNGHPQRPSAPTYTSAIMRNQRPPNVNIGPDGLNISQPRHPQEWPHGISPISGAQGSRVGAPVTSAAMMQHYRSYSSDGHTASSAAAAAAQMQMHQQQGQRSMHIDSMQSQQAAMMQQGGTHAQQMMIQQQRMHMSQMGQGSHNSQSPPYSMTSQPGSNYSQTSSSQDDILNLLDTAPNQSTDFFDVQTSSGGTEANWFEIDDILGNPK